MKEYFSQISINVRRRVVAKIDQNVIILKRRDQGFLFPLTYYQRSLISYLITTGLVCAEKNRDTWFCLLFYTHCNTFWRHVKLLGVKTLSRGTALKQSRSRFKRRKKFRHYGYCGQKFCTLINSLQINKSSVSVFNSESPSLRVQCASVQCKFFSPMNSEPQNLYLKTCFKQQRSLKCKK